MTEWLSTEVSMTHGEYFLTSCIGYMLARLIVTSVKSLWKRGVTDEEHQA